MNKSAPRGLAPVLVCLLVPALAIALIYVWQVQRSWQMEEYQQALRENAKAQAELHMAKRQAEMIHRASQARMVIMRCRRCGTVRGALRWPDGLVLCPPCHGLVIEEWRQRNKTPGGQRPRSGGESRSESDH